MRLEAQLANIFGVHFFEIGDDKSLKAEQMAQFSNRIPKPTEMLETPKNVAKDRLGKSVGEVFSEPELYFVNLPSRTFLEIRLLVKVAKLRKRLKVGGA